MAIKLGLQTLCRLFMRARDCLDLQLLDMEGEFCLHERIERIVTCTLVLAEDTTHGVYEVGCIQVQAWAKSSDLENIVEKGLFDVTPFYLASDLGEAEISIDGRGLMAMRQNR